MRFFGVGHTVHKSDGERFMMRVSSQFGLGSWGLFISGAGERCGVGHGMNCLYA